jgi:sporadic carbohydrate cluster 2OG-Fe(II) oxygenase
MLKNYYKNQSNNSKQLIDNGFFIADIENIDFLNEIRSNFIDFIKQEFSFDLEYQDLEKIHKYIGSNIVNEVRVKFFQEMNASSNNFNSNYLTLAKNSMYEVVGTELASNKMVNFSIQMPNDNTSILPIHSDMFSGESPFQINLWVPLTDAKDTNSMFIFNPSFSKQVCSQLSYYEKAGLNQLMDSNKSEYQFLNVPYGKALIFTPTCLHGNVLNTSNKTRMSFNCRYKNLFSPYSSTEESDKKLGSFYSPLSPKAASLIGLDFKLDE